MIQISKLCDSKVLEYPALISAVNVDDAELVNKILEVPNCKIEPVQLLGISVLMNSTDIMKLLIDKYHIDLNASYYDGGSYNLLLIAAVYGYVDMTELLINNGLDPYLWFPQYLNTSLDPDSFTTPLGMNMERMTIVDVVIYYDNVELLEFYYDNYDIKPSYGTAGRYNSEHSFFFLLNKEYHVEHKEDLDFYNQLTTYYMKSLPIFMDSEFSDDLMVFKHNIGDHIFLVGEAEDLIFTSSG